MVVGGLSLCVLGAAKGRSRMVYGFVIHTVGATLDETPNSSRVLYSKVFNYDMLDQKQNSDEQYLHNERIKRKQRIAIVAREKDWGMNRDGAPGKSPEEMYIQQKVRVLLMLRKMGSNLTPSEEAFLRSYAGVVNSQLSQLPQHSLDQGAEDVVMAFSRSETEDRRQ
uniref:Beta-catenin-interacting protein 1 n=5 Tax=Xenopus TaxID=8353 RepID=A0A803JRJ2_XENTR